MILNGYDTFLGSKFKISDSVPSTLKMLSTTNRLEKINSNGVYGVNHENGDMIKPFVFPMTLEDYRKNRITVLDQRIYLNTKGQIVNPHEYEMMEVASVLQQKVASGDKSIIRLALPAVIIGYVKAISLKLTKNAGLSMSQKMDLDIILAHYFVCLQNTSDDDYIFVSQNVINKALKYKHNTTLPIIEQIGFINTLKDLVEAIKTYPTLSSLNKLDVGGFIGLVNLTWYVSSGYKVILGASLEMPHLMTAICFVSIKHNLYKKTDIGRFMDPKENSLSDSMLLSVQSSVF